MEPDTHRDTASTDCTRAQDVESVKLDALPPVASNVKPEGGSDGWICVLGAFLSLFCTFGFLNAIGVFQTYYQATTLKDYSSSDIAWIFAVQLALMWAFGPLYGRLTDSFGPAPVLYPCSILCVFALCMTSLATEYYQIFLAQGVAFGLGAGGTYTSTIVCVGQWFVKRRGLASGIASAGSSLGGVLFPIFFVKVIPRVGFYGAVRYAALLIGILLFVSCLMIKSRLPRKKWDPKTPWLDLRFFKAPEFALYVFGAYFVMWGLWAPFNFLPSMAQTIGFSSSLSLYLISLINAASIPGRVLPNYLGDKLGRFNILTITSFCTGGSILTLWLPFDFHHSHADIIIFALVYGFVSGGVVSLFMPCVAKIGKMENLGVRFGTFQTVIALSSLTGLPIQGAILNRQHGDEFFGLQIFASVSALLGTLLIVASNSLLRKQFQTWRV